MTQHSATPQTDNPPLGIMLMVGFCILAPFSETFVKLLGASIPLLQVVFARFFAQLFLIRPRLWTNRQNGWAARGILPWIILRSILHLCAIACFFLSLRFLPLADALAIAYVMPFLILGAGFFVGDRPTPLQLLLCLIGFVGTLMVVQPSFANVGLPALLPLIVAVLFTGFVLITRKFANRVDPIDLQAINGAIAVITMVPLIIVGAWWAIPEMMMIQVTPLQWFYLAMVGALGTIAHLCMTWSLKLARPSVVAPAQYLEIPFGAMFGLVVFSEFPNGMAAAGIVVVIAAGLTVLATNRR